jgi:hypothetical protein
MVDDFVVRLGAHGVQTNGECLLEAVWNEVNLGAEKLSDQ